jgi:nucleoside-diphosphate kinase
MAEEMFDIYANIYPSYSQMIEQMCSGPSLAVMIEGDENVTTEFRAFAGPQHPELAKTLRPQSLRTQFGVDDTLNAVHCTDLTGDGDMECRYFFETLAGL